tara:strand:+ start:515 stop:1036 length:522 start_codon:yes stop_codon:yes gene_type:complete
MPLLNQEINYLSAVSFDTNFARIPKTSFTCTSVSIPSLALGITNYASLFSDLPIEGDKINFEQLSISFIVNEDFSNYIEVFNWITSIGFPDSFDQFSLKDSLAQSTSTNTLRSDMNIIVNTNKSNPNYNILFKDAFPTSLGNIDFNAGSASIDPIIVQATFAFAGRFTITKIT